MALMPRVKLAGDLETPEMVSVIDILKLYGERLGVGLKGFEAIAPDTRDAEALWHLFKAQIRRANLSITIHRHNCPHVPGVEEPTWTACTDPQYGYEIEEVS